MRPPADRAISRQQRLFHLDLGHNPPPAPRAPRRPLPSHGGGLPAHTGAEGPSLRGCGGWAGPEPQAAVPARCRPDLDRRGGTGRDGTGRPPPGGRGEAGARQRPARHHPTAAITRPLRPPPCRSPHTAPPHLEAPLQSANRRAQ